MHDDTFWFFTFILNIVMAARSGWSKAARVTVALYGVLVLLHFALRAHEKKAAAVAPPVPPGQ